MSAETANLLQFLATLGLVLVSAAYVWAANRQANASEESLRLVTRHERSKAVEELRDLKTKVQHFANLLPDYAHAPSLEKSMSNRGSHKVKESILQEIRVLASGLKPLGLETASLALQAVEHAETVRRSWGTARRELESEGAERPTFQKVLGAAQQARSLFKEATARADEELEELPSRPV